MNPPSFPNERGLSIEVVSAGFDPGFGVSHAAHFCLLSSFEIIQTLQFQPFGLNFAIRSLSTFTSLETSSFFSSTFSWTFFGAKAVKFPKDGAVDSFLSSEGGAPKENVALGAAAGPDPKLKAPAAFVVAPDPKTKLDLEAVASLDPLSVGLPRAFDPKAKDGLVTAVSAVVSTPFPEDFSPNTKEGFGESDESLLPVSAGLLRKLKASPAGFGAPANPPNPANTFFLSSP